MLERYLLNYTYLAEMGKLILDISVLKRGLCLKLKGYSDKAAIFLE